jgi:hypothetical protein
MPEPHPFPDNPDAVRAEDLDLSRVPGYGQDEPEEPMPEPVEDTRSTLQVIQGGMADPPAAPEPVQEEIPLQGAEAAIDSGVEPAQDDIPDDLQAQVDAMGAADPFEARIGVDAATFHDLIVARGLDPDLFDPDTVLPILEEEGVSGPAEVRGFLDRFKANAEAEGDYLRLKRDVEEIKSQGGLSEEHQAIRFAQEQAAAEADAWVANEQAALTVAYEDAMVKLQDAGGKPIEGIRFFSTMNSLGLLGGGAPAEQAVRLTLAYMAVGGDPFKAFNGQSVAAPDGPRIVGTGPRAQRVETITIPAAPSAQRQPQTVEDLLLGN